MEGTDENNSIMQLTSASLIDAYQYEPSLWDYRLNSSEDEREREHGLDLASCSASRKCIYQYLLLKLL
jgi:hypothetical protein